MPARLTSYRFTLTAFLFAVLAASNALAQDMNWGTQPDTASSIKVQLFAQLWTRYNQNNPGTLALGQPQDESFDIGVRRARVQAFANINSRATLFIHYGFNNFNYAYQSANNRRIQAYFHDFFAEYRLSDANELKIGAGLSFVNGLSRFTQPAIIALPTLDGALFAQATSEQNDVTGRKLSVTARGQIGPIDYRVALSDPMAVSLNGQTPRPIAPQANFAQNQRTLQQQAYVIYQFFDHEPHQVANMAGTYYGTRKIFNVAAGVIYQPDAMWRSRGADTVYEDLLLMAVESMYDAPIDRWGTTLSAYAGLFHHNYGSNYLRYNGAMNTGTSMLTSDDSTALRPLTQYGPSWGNAFPMYGSGEVFFTHVGVFVPRVLGAIGIMPYVSANLAWYERLNRTLTDVYGIGCSILLDGIRSRVTLELQNRPTYGVDISRDPFGELVNGERRSQVALQYQVVW
jgi:hypothetical protein